MHFPRLPTIAAGIVFAIAPLTAQSTRPSSSVGAGPPGPTVTTSNAPRLPDMVTTMSITGKVVLDDGSPLPEPAKIEQTCGNGQPRAMGFTDQKGHFSINLGQQQAVIGDASETNDRNTRTIAAPEGGTTEAKIFNCELRAAIPGFRSEVVSLANHRYMDNPDVGSIVLHRMANVQGLTTSATSALAPKEARKAYEKGVEAMKKNKPDEAQKDLERAVAAYPKYAAAWFELGRVYDQRDHLDLARHAFTESIAADANYIPPYERMYIIALKESKWQEMADASEHVLRLNPYDFPDAYYFNAVANAQLNHLDLAEKNAREAVKLDTAHQNPKASYLLGVILMDRQNLPEAAQYLRAYLAMVPNGKESDNVRKQLDQIEKALAAKAQPH